VLTDLRLEPTDALVLAYLSSLRDADGWAWPSNERIARDLRLTYGSVADGLARLIAAGWLATRAAEGRIQYRICWYAEGGEAAGVVPPPSSETGTLLPEDFPSAVDRHAAADMWPEVDIESAARRFRAYHGRLGSRRANWVQAWLSWVRRSRTDDQRDPVDAGASGFGAAVAELSGAVREPGDR